MENEWPAIIMTGIVMVGCALAMLLWGTWRYPARIMVPLFLSGLAVSMGLYALLVGYGYPILPASAGLALPFLFIFYPASRYRDARFFYTVCQTYLPGISLLLLISYCLQSGNDAAALFLLFSGAAVESLLLIRFRDRYRMAQEALSCGWLQLVLLTAAAWLPMIGIIGWIPQGGFLCLITQAAGYLAAGWIIKQQWRLDDLSRDTRALRERIRELEACYDMAYRDALTKAGNRAALDRDMQRMAQHRVGWISCWMMDLNNLKETNDTYGHAAGDRLLVGLSKTARDVLGSYGSIYRIGGDEFLVLLPEAEGDDRFRRESALHDAIETYNRKRAIPISVAVGGATGYIGAVSACETLTRLQALIEEADRQMYCKKRRRRESDVTLV